MKADVTSFFVVEIARRWMYCLLNPLPPPLAARVPKRGADAFGVFLDQLWPHFLVKLGSPWGHAQVILDQFGVILGSSWSDFRTRCCPDQCAKNASGIGELNHI